MKYLIWEFILMILSGIATIMLIVATGVAFSNGMFLYGIAFAIIAVVEGYLVFTHYDAWKFLKRHIDLEEYEEK